MKNKSAVLRGYHLFCVQLKDVTGDLHGTLLHESVPKGDTLDFVLHLL